MPSIARTRDGYRIEVSREVDATPEAAWQLLVTPEQWPAWGPSVRAVDCDDDRIEAGTSGKVRLPGGVWLPFEVVTCEAPGENRPGRWSWRVARIPATGHRVEAVATDCARVVFEIPPAAAGYAPVCSRALDRIESVLTGEQG